MRAFNLCVALLMLLVWEIKVMFVLYVTSRIISVLFKESVCPFKASRSCELNSHMVGLKEWLKISVETMTFCPQ